MAANSATELPRVFLPTTFYSYKRTISLASFTCEGCGFWTISKLDRKADTSGVQCNGQNDIHVKFCRLASKKHRVGPKMVSEAILYPLNFKNFLGKHVPKPPLGIALLCLHYQSEHSKFDGYSPVFTPKTY